MFTLGFPLWRLGFIWGFVLDRYCIFRFHLFVIRMYQVCLTLCSSRKYPYAPVHHHDGYWKFLEGAGGGGLKPKSLGKYEPNWNFPRDGIGEGVKPKISSWARFLIIEDSESIRRWKSRATHSLSNYKQLFLLILVF